MIYSTNLYLDSLGGNARTVMVANMVIIISNKIVCACVCVCVDVHVLMSLCKEYIKGEVDTKIFFYVLFDKTLISNF